MLALVVIIEKDGDTYIGRSPNLPGLSATAKTFEEAQNAITDAMDERIRELHGMHNHQKPISRRPIEETIGCVYNYAELYEKGQECCQSATKDGLCLIHWRKLYGHPYGLTLKTCPLCGEDDKDVLGNLGSPCSFKIENSDWENLFEEMKVKNRSAWAKERREVKLEKLGRSLRCHKIETDGTQCVREMYAKGLCHIHLSREYRAERKEVDRLKLQQERNLQHFMNRPRDKR